MAGVKTISALQMWASSGASSSGEERVEVTTHYAANQDTQCQHDT